MSLLWKNSLSAAATNLKVLTWTEWKELPIRRQGVSGWCDLEGECEEMGLEGALKGLEVELRESFVKIW